MIVTNRGYSGGVGAELIGEGPEDIASTRQRRNLLIGQDLIDRRTPEIALRQIGIARAAEFQHDLCAVVGEPDGAMRLRFAQTR